MDLPINKTLATEVILLGFSQNDKINLAAIYLVTISGNGFMVCIVIFSSHLHTPMYFFLCNLAFIDFCYSSSAVPKLVVDLVILNGTTSIPACMIQVFTATFLANSESFLLVVMAYDRYVAICRPLNYPVDMSFMTTVFPSLLTPIRVCNPNQINHIACEVLTVIKLSCDSTKQNEIMIRCFSFFSLSLPFVFILISYIFIISSVLKIRSSGRSKAFSTCSSHLTVVVMFYGTAMIMYLGPSTGYTSNQGKYISVFYGVIIPMLNPLIYSVKNKE
ncbi:hypothetical protein GDO81_027626, partial [Engystomops pustulosus]